MLPCHHNALFFNLKNILHAQTYKVTHTLTAIHIDYIALMNTYLTYQNYAENEGTTAERSIPVEQIVFSKLKDYLTPTCMLNLAPKVLGKRLS